MGIDRVLSHSTGDRLGSRHHSLALRWEPLTGLGEGRILARGPEALGLYQSDFADSFGAAGGGRMSLGRIGEHGRFIPLIRRTITSFASDTGPVLIPGLLSSDTDGTGDPAAAQ